MAAKHASQPSMPKDTLALLCTAEEAETVRALLSDEEIDLVPSDIDDLCPILERGNPPAVLVSAETTNADDLSRICRAIAASGDVSPPIILLTERASLPKAAELLRVAKVQIVERPLDGVILSHMARIACRMRWRQRQVHALEHELKASEEHHRQAIQTLEASRQRQIADLEALSKRLSEEVDERKRTEEALRESEQLYRYTVELSRQVSWTSVPGDTTIPSSPRLNEMVGLPPGSSLQDVFRTAVHPDDIEAATAAWLEAFGKGVPYFREFRIRMADGSYHSVTSRAVPRLDESGNVVRWYGFIEDINDQKLATDALRLAEERYRLAARATNDAIWDWDLASGQVAWSDAAAAYLGNSPLEDSTIDFWKEAIHADDRERVVRSITRAVEGDKARWSAAYRLRKADGDYAYVYDRGFIIRNADGAAVRAVGAVVDLTERRRAESELRRTQAELIHMSRVSAMGTMASTLAHELNQPLTAVTSYVRGSRRLLATFDDPAIRQVCEALEFAEAGALRAGQIVRRLRELVARGTVEVQPEDLLRLVEDASVLAFVDEQLHGISHEIRIPPEVRWVEADRIQIQQVLINLIRNAIQALQDSEVRHVTVSARPIGEDMIEVSVTDTGAGIPAGVRDALFSPFQSTKSEGMGIGLSISRTIVEAHHGLIWAEDGPEGGAVFRFTLPRADAATLDELGDLIDSDGSERTAV